MSKLGKIFMLDDDVILLDMYKTLLESWGYEVFTTSNAYKYLMYAREMMPDIFILDLNMPETNGWDVLQMLKQEEKLHKVPVVILTIQSERELAEAAEVAHYLHKPLEAAKLQEIVETYCVGNKNHDLLLLDDFRPMLSALKDEIEKRGWRCFEIHDLGAAQGYLQKNNPKVVAVSLEGQYDETKGKLDHQRVMSLENLQNLNDIGLFLK